MLTSIYFEGLTDHEKQNNKYIRVGPYNTVILHVRLSK